MNNCYHHVPSWFFLKRLLSYWRMKWFEHLNSLCWAELRTELQGMFSKTKGIIVVTASAKSVSKWSSFGIFENSVFLKAFWDSDILFVVFDGNNARNALELGVWQVTWPTCKIPTMLSGSIGGKVEIQVEIKSGDTGWRWRWCFDLALIRASSSAVVRCCSVRVCCSVLWICFRV